MALQLGALRDALDAAKVPPDKARAAAEEVAGYDLRLHGIETRLAVLMLMVGGLYALVAPAVWLLLRIGAKVGAF